MRIVVLNTDYPAFLRNLYKETPELAAAPYDEQIAVRNGSLFGVANFYSSNFVKHGAQAWDIHVNNLHLQCAWAREHGMQVDASHVEEAAPRDSRVKRWAVKSLQLKRGGFPVFSTPRVIATRYGRSRTSALEYRILAAQIEHYRPDVILNQDMGYVRSDVLRSIRPRGATVLGQIAASIPGLESFDAYDMVLSSLPNMVDWFRRHGVPARYSPLAFEASVLERLGPAPECDIDVSFVGSLSADHAGRMRLIEYVARHTPLKVWASGTGAGPGSAIADRLQGEVWGRQMYQVLRRSKITLNHHIDLAEGYANNMRLYEATGVGCMMLVNAARNLGDIFIEGREVVTYGSPEECVEKIRYYLDHAAERTRLAALGQQRTLQSHTYEKRAGELLRVLADLRSGHDARPRAHRNPAR